MKKIISLIKKGVRNIVNNNIYLPTGMLPIR